MNNKNTLVLFGALFLSACGGGGDNASSRQYVPPGSAVLLFEDDFETGNLSKTVNGFRWTDRANTGVSNAAARSGSYSLEFTYTTQPDGDAMSEQRFYLGGNYRDVSVEYDILIPSNYYHRTQSGPANNKGFLYLWANTYADPRPLVATNFWPDNSGQSIGSVYTRPNDLGHYMEFTAPAISTSDVGNWMHIVVRYAYASPSNNDGIAQIWKTPGGGSTVQILNKTNGAWYHAQGTGFDNGYLLGWSNSGFDQVTRFYIDNVKVWGAR